MSVREFSPLFSWGFSLRRSKWLVPLFNNNVFSFGNSAVNGPYGWNNTPVQAKAVDFAQASSSSSNKAQNNTQIREKHASVAVEQTITSQIPIIDMKQEQPQIQQQQQQSEKQEHPVVAPPQKKKKPMHMNDENKTKLAAMNDGELITLLQDGSIGHYSLESFLDANRAVKIRRMYLAGADVSVNNFSNSFNELPYEHYKFEQVRGQCCENVVGYVPIPVGVIGPFKIDGKDFIVPLATVEGALVASTNRGAKAISVCGGANTVVINDGMTRGPVVQMPNAKRAANLKHWFQNPDNFAKITTVFNETSRFARLTDVKIGVAGRKVFLRFKCVTGDAMGMNMITKATHAAITYLKTQFADMDVLGLSGNYCTDKKPSAMNWLEGRGKSVIADAVISSKVVHDVLKTTVDDLVRLNIDKNLIGSAMAGSIGGYNAHASNIVTAIFLATGQDCAQNVESSNCITLMEKNQDGDLYISVTMPSIEVGTVGGGTNLAPQSACLQMLGVKGAHEKIPGDNAQQLARIVAATVMAGELSLMSALSMDQLLSAHLKLNRK